MDGTGRFLIAEHRGVIQLWVPSQPDTPLRVVLDIQDRVWQNSSPCCAEQGLIGMTLPPGIGAKDHVFVSYVDRDSNVVVSRFQMDPETALADPGQETILQKLYHPEENHFGGTLAFSPYDSMLYWSIGDGSSGTDVQHAQVPHDPFGKILRFNPYEEVQPDQLYPRLEVYALGFRNPWRFSFDPFTGDMFIGDVGENTFEELNQIPAGTLAGAMNFGWGIMEGFECYEYSDCNKEGLAVPIYAYEHPYGCSITAGEAYYGSLHPQWQGRYFFADFCKGTVWSTVRKGDEWETVEHVYYPNHQISTFARGEDGELYVAKFTSGEIFRLAPKAAETPEPGPSELIF